MISDLRENLFDVVTGKGKKRSKESGTDGNHESSGSNPEQIRAMSKFLFCFCFLVVLRLNFDDACGEVY